MVFPGPQECWQGWSRPCPLWQPVLVLCYEQRGYCLHGFGQMAPRVSDTPRTLLVSSCDIGLKEAKPETFRRFLCLRSVLATVHNLRLLLSVLEVFLPGRGPLCYFFHNPQEPCPTTNFGPWPPWYPHSSCSLGKGSVLLTLRHKGSLLATPPLWLLDIEHGNVQVGSWIPGSWITNCQRALQGDLGGWCSQVLRGAHRAPLVFFRGLKMSRSWDLKVEVIACRLLARWLL